MSTVHPSKTQPRKGKLWVAVVYPLTGSVCSDCGTELILRAPDIEMCPKCSGWCVACKSAKSRSQFSAGVFRRGRRGGDCRDCKLKTNRKAHEIRIANGKALIYERLETTKRIRFNTKLKREFGITVDDYERMLDEQKGLCKICQKPEREFTSGHGGQFVPNRLAVDHDHETGAVRGLLCNKCNQAIGCLSHSVERLQAAIQYLLTTEIVESTVPDKSNDKKPNPLAETLLAGLAQENASPDEVDDAKMKQALAVEPEDLLLPPDQDADEGDGGDEDD